MTYATKLDLIDRFGEAELTELTDDDGIGIPDDVRVNKSLADADAEINAYLGGFTLPLTTVPTLIVNWAADIARYQLHRHGASEHVAAAYTTARKSLAELRDGKLNLGLDAAGDQVNTTTGSPQVVGGDRTFSQESLIDY